MDAVIVCYRSLDCIATSVRAVQSIPGIGSVLVVDNGQDGSGGVAAGMGATVLGRADNPGFGTSQNLGASHLSGEYLLLLNPDAEVVPSSIAEGERYLESNPDVAAVQGVIRSRGNGHPERSQGSAIRPVHLLGRAFGLRALLRSRLVAAFAARVGPLRDHVIRDPAAAQDVEWLAATALLIRRVAFEAVGGFDERYFLYGEDQDLSRRLRLNGWRLVALPNDWALHASGASSGTSVERERWWWKGTLQYAANWWPSIWWAAAVIAGAVAWARVAVHAPRQARSLWNDMVGWGISSRRRRDPSALR